MQLGLRAREGSRAWCQELEQHHLLVAPLGHKAALAVSQEHLAVPAGSAPAEQRWAQLLQLHGGRDTRNDDRVCV